jgi:hypothetical protein
MYHLVQSVLRRKADASTSARRHEARQTLLKLRRGLGKAIDANTQ